METRLSALALAVFLALLGAAYYLTFRLAQALTVEAVPIHGQTSHS